MVEELQFAYFCRMEKEINFKISLDENHLPTEIKWGASDAGEGGMCDAILLNLWDSKDKNTLRIDLWTKDMLVDDMKIFFHQMMLAMSDTFGRATGEEEMSLRMRDFAQEFGRDMKLIKEADS